MHSDVPQGSVIDSLLFLISVNDFPDALKALTLLFTDDVKMVIRRAQNISLYSSLVIRLQINPANCNYLTIWREVPLRTSSFQDWSRIPMPVSNYVENLGFQAGNVLSPSAQCTDARTKARRLTFLTRRPFQDLSKSVFIPFNGSLVRPHLEYDMLACSPNLVTDFNHLERIPRLATDW